VTTLGLNAAILGASQSGSGSTRIELIGLILAVLVFLFGDGVLRLVGNLFTRRYKWEPRPFVDTAGRFKAGVSHEYETKRTITHASVVMQPSLPLRTLTLLLRWRRLPRNLIILSLLAGNETIDVERGSPMTWQTTMPLKQSLPSWNLLRGYKSKDLAKVRLMCVIQFGRRSAMSKRVRRLSRGQIEPGPLESTAVADPHAATTRPRSTSAR
jgi:hypothetical protein